VWHRLRDALNEPKTWVRIHGALTVAWILLITPSVLFWRDSVAWLVIMSVWANVASSAASWQAAKADRSSVSMDDLRRVEGKIDQLLGKASLLVTRGR
jgi:hypothetical protein